MNEFQTGANLSGSNRLQCIVNVGALHTLCQYALNASPYETTTSSVDAATTAAWSVIASDGTDAVATGGAGVARIASFRRKSGHAPVRLVSLYDFCDKLALTLLANIPSAENESYSCC